MARKYSKGKKPEETIRQRQQRLLKEQRARKAAQTNVKTNPASSTPRGAQGPRTAPQQGPSQRTNGLQGTRKRTAVQRSAPKPEFSTSTKVSSKQKALPPGKKGGALATTKALPPGKKGGPVSTGNRPRRRNVNSNPSSNVTRTGSQSPASVRREQAAVRRAKAEIGRKRAGPLSTLAGTAIEAVLRPVARGIGYQGGKAIRKALGGGEPTLDSKGKPIKKNKPNNAAEVNARLRQQRKDREAAAARSGNNNNSQILRPAPGKGDPKPKSSPAPTYTPPKGRATAPPKKTGANDPRNAAYIAARKKLNANSSKAERDKVRDMGLALSKSIHGDKGGRGSKKPETSKPANVGPVKDGAKYARSLAKSGVRRGANDAAKADKRIQATESVRAGMRQGRTADKNNEKKKKQRRFSNESLRKAGQRTYNRGSA